MSLFTKCKIALSSIFLMFSCALFSSDNLVDLEIDWLDDFVLETKKIEIPGYPNAFNACIMPWGDFYLMSFRTYMEPDEYVNLGFCKPASAANRTKQIAVVILDNEFNQVSEPQLLDIHYDDPNVAAKQQDPRLVTVGDQIYMVYSNVIFHFFGESIRRVFVLELSFNGESFDVSKPSCFFQFETNRKASRKKLVPFDYQGNLFLAYSLLPHRIFLPFFNGPANCKTVALTAGDIDWSWGELRGGTPALLDGDQYLSFFHSAIQMESVQSEGKEILHYFMGAYTFSNTPPFSITAMSPKPIVGPNFYNGPKHETWKPLLVVFPCGIAIDEDYVYVSYGRQDHEIWIAKIDKQGLLDSLVPVDSL